MRFRSALLLGVAGVTALWIAGLVTAAIASATLLGPVLFAIYLYDVQIYREEPVRVVALTIGAGVVLGALYTIVRRSVLGSPPVAGPLNFDLQGVALSAVTAAVVQEVLKAAPLLGLGRRERFAERMDGITFGVLSGVGFSAGTVGAAYLGLLAALPVRTDPANWLPELMSLGLLQPLMQASATGALAGAVWSVLRRGWSGRALLGVGVALGGHFAFNLGGDLLRTVGPGQPAQAAWQLLVDLLLVLYLRDVIHRSLIEEAVDLGLQQIRCPNCAEQVVAAGFCPHCGGSVQAAPHAVRVAASPIGAAPA